MTPMRERELITSLRREIIGYQKQIAELARDERLFVPGVWRCPVCHFVLTRTSISASTGKMGTTAEDREETEPCANDGTPMIRVAWSERARELGVTCTQYVEKLADIEGRLEIAEGFIPPYMVGQYREKIDQHIERLKDLFQ